MKFKMILIYALVLVGMLSISSFVLSNMERQNEELRQLKREYQLEKIDLKNENEALKDLQNLDKNGQAFMKGCLEEGGGYLYCECFYTKVIDTYSKEYFNKISKRAFEGNLTDQEANNIINLAKQCYEKTR